MTVRRLQPDGDITTRGDQFLTGRFEAGQTVSTRLRLFLKEYFRDITEGTPWFQEILGKGQSLETKEAALRRRIQQTPGVRGIISFDTDFDLQSRTYSVSASVLTNDGVIAIDETGLVNG